MNGSIARVPGIEYKPHELHIAMHQVVRRTGWSDNGQIALTCSEEESRLHPRHQIFGDAIKPSRENGEIVRNDSDYTFFIQEFNDTLFYDIWREHCEGLCRMRLMRLMPKTGLSFHEDFCARFHFAITTNPAAFFLTTENDDWAETQDGFTLPGVSVSHIPADGRMYRVNTRRLHTVYNGGNTERIHLVVSGP